MINTTFTKLKSFGLGLLIDTRMERMVGTQVLSFPCSILLSLGTHQFEMNIGRPTVVFDYANMQLSEVERG